MAQTTFIAEMAVAPIGETMVVSYDSSINLVEIMTPDYNEEGWPCGKVVSLSLDSHEAQFLAESLIKAAAIMRAHEMEIE